MKRDLTSIPNKKAWEWSLVLSAMSIPHKRETHGNESAIEVSEEFLEEACRQIDFYEQENSSEKLLNFSYASPLVSVLRVFFTLFIFQSFLYQSGSYDIWLKAGNSSNIDIRSGEIWRIFTALTLHTGLEHFLSNAFMGSVIFYSLFSMTGSGTGLFLAILAGAAGNLATAFIIPLEYHSIGSSGSIFGAFGVLAAYRIIRITAKAKKTDWRPAAAALTFLGLFGTAGGSDFFGHFFSLLAGFLIGSAAAVLSSVEKLPPPAVRFTFAILSVAMLTISWLRAMDRL